MNAAKHHPLRRLIVLLCSALALLSAGSGVAGVIDHLQHGAAVSKAHHHTMFSDVGWSAEATHSSHQDGDRDDDRPVNYHHHHADAGSGLPVLIAGDEAPFLNRSTLRVLTPDPFVMGLAPSGPDRPPRAFHSIA